MQEPPWKVVRRFATENGGALVHLHNVSGGVLSGDRLNASIDVGRNCEVQITTTGSTRIYKAREGRAAAYQELHASVAQGALLEHVPDSIIPFGNSRFVQRSCFELAPDAGLFAWEVIAAGRSGEPFAFAELQIETQVRTLSRLAALDCWRIQPVSQRVNGAIRLGGYSHQASFYVCRAGVAFAEWLRWEKAMAEIAVEVDSAKQIWGVSALHGDGMVFRGLATESLYLIDTLIRFWRMMKRELYGREPVLPRKMS